MKEDDAARGACPSCDEEGPVAEACPQKICAKRNYVFVPRHYHAKLAERGTNDPIVGRLIHDYLVVDVLGAGGFGTVYLALQQPIQMKAALKLMNLRADPDIADMMLEKFRSEAAALASLSHPNVVRLLKYGKFGQLPYLVMEFVDGGHTLKDEVAACALAGQALDVGVTMHLLHQVLNALEAAHERSIVHRDIKPDNIMLQPISGDPMFVRVLDFGLAKFTDERSLTSTTVGTPVYMAPEQLTKGRIGPWTDLYAVGVMAYELLTGLSPFPGQSQQAILTKKIDPDYDPTHRLTDRLLPASMVAFFERAIHRNDKMRFQDAAAFRSALDELHAAMASDPQAHGVADMSELVDDAAISRARRKGLTPSSPNVTAPPRRFPLRGEAPADMRTGPGYGEGATQSHASNGVFQTGTSQARATAGVPAKRRRKSLVPFVVTGVGIAAVVVAALMTAVGDRPTQSITSSAKGTSPPPQRTSPVSPMAVKSVERPPTWADTEAKVPSSQPAETDIHAAFRAAMLVAAEHVAQRRWADALGAFGKALALQPDEPSAKQGFERASAEQTRAGILKRVKEAVEDHEYRDAQEQMAQLVGMGDSVYRTEAESLKRLLSSRLASKTSSATEGDAVNPRILASETVGASPPSSGAGKATNRDKKTSKPQAVSSPKSAQDDPTDRSSSPPTSGGDTATAKKANRPKQATSDGPPPKTQSGSNNRASEAAAAPTSEPSPPPSRAPRTGSHVKVRRLGKVARSVKGRVKKITTCSAPKVRCKALRNACVEQRVCKRLTP